MKNVTITLEEGLAHWAKVMAARHNKSLSRFLSELLEKMRATIGDEKNIVESFRSFKPRPISKPGERAFCREQIYDRTRLS